MLGRRHILTTAAAFALSVNGPAKAAGDTTVSESSYQKAFRATKGDPLFTIGQLSANRVAGEFASTPQLTGPFALRLTDGNGPRDLSELTGKVRLVSLWAENFPPCLHLLNELAELQTLYGDADFEIMALLTQSPGRLDYTAAHDLLVRLQAENLPLWIEPDGGNQTTRALSTMLGPYPKGDPFADWPVTNVMPCILIVDKNGRIRGRTLGSTLMLKKNAIRTRWQTPLPVDLTEPGRERKPTVWSGADADIFIKALKAGELERLGEAV